MSSKSDKYQRLIQQIPALIDPLAGKIANYANVIAAIQEEFKHWWCGFYFVNAQNQLELGPFQGPVACTRIDFNKGVCGSSWANKKTIVVPDVHQFEGHIACSTASNSEIVIPMFHKQEVIGVLDIDSLAFNQFDEEDQLGLESIVKMLESLHESIPV